jgi:Ca2+/H+ antiporter, TMEM165/GDT1 family
MYPWSSAASVLSAAFLGSLVEFVEAFTIILAVATVRGWRPALAGTVGGIVALAVLVALLGRAIDDVPIHWLQFVVGTLLLLFGLRWLRKAILRAAVVISRHDETRIFIAEINQLRATPSRPRGGFDWLAAVTAFKAVVIEGVEVVFIVLAVGSGRGLVWPAAAGAMAAGLAVLAAGIILHRPLARVPENTLKFVVGVLLSSFGVFWTGEGLGIAWPGSDAALVGLIAAFLLASLGATWMARPDPKTA